MRAPSPPDLLAGLTLWAVFAAQALAYSRLAHATPVSGLVTAIAGAAIYSLVGSSIRNSIGPAGAVAAIVGTAAAGVPAERAPDFIAATTLLAALFLLLAGVLRIRALKRLFPLPVFVGYLAGTGVTILIGQAREIVGGGALAIGVGGAAIAGVLALKKAAPRIPGPFAILLAATVLSAALGAAERGVPVIGSSLGELGRFVWPLGVGWSEYQAAFMPALSLALLVYVDDLGNAEALARNEDPPIRPIREYFALSATNLASALWGGFMAGCSSSRSIVAIRSGARTRWAGIVAAALLLLTSFSVVRWIEPMPLPALAGVVLVAAIDLIDVRKLRELRALRPADFRIALLAMAGVVALGPIQGAGIGVLMALLEALRRAMEPHRSVLSPGAGERYYRPFDARDVPVVDGTLVYRFGAPLFFGNADVFLEDMRRLALSAPPSLRAVVVNAEAIGVPDATAHESLRKAQDALEKSRIRLAFGNARSEVREALLSSGRFSVVRERDFIEVLGTIRKGAQSRSAVTNRAKTPNAATPSATIGAKERGRSG